MDKNLQLVFQISALHNKVLKAIDSQLSIHGLTFSEFLVMNHLNLKPTKTMKRIDLANDVGMSASGITRLLTPMEKLKIVQKEASQRDARISFVKLTDVGEKLFEDTMQTVKATAKELFEDLYDFDMEKLIEILHKIK